MSRKTRPVGICEQNAHLYNIVRCDMSSPLRLAGHYLGVTLALLRGSRQ
jgi:hypothetical protein